MPVIQKKGKAKLTESVVILKKGQSTVTQSDEKELVGLNFKVTPDFRREYRQFAANHDLSNIDILRMGFDLVKQQYE